MSLTRGEHSDTDIRARRQPKLSSVEARPLQTRLLHPVWAREPSNHVESIMLVIHFCVNGNPPEVAYFESEVLYLGWYWGLYTVYGDTLVIFAKGREHTRQTWNWEEL